MKVALVVLEGHELHASLVTQQIDDVRRLHVSRAVLRNNPQVSTDADSVEAIARSGSQGRLGGEGIHLRLVLKQADDLEASPSARR